MSYIRVFSIVKIIVIVYKVNYGVAVIGETCDDLPGAILPNLIKWAEL